MKRNLERSDVKRLMFLTVLALAAAACGNDDTGGDAAGTPHNEADVIFAQQMIAHHEQALEMAEMALEQSSTDEVSDLARRIQEAQTPEIETMKAWLTGWDEPASPEGMPMDHGAAGGMMSEAQMNELQLESGKAFDRAFLEMMMEHHRGAIVMATDQIENGQFPDAVALARAIKDAQEAEVREMEGLLEDLD